MDTGFMKRHSCPCVIRIEFHFLPINLSRLSERAAETKHEAYNVGSGGSDHHREMGGMLLLKQELKTTHNEKLMADSGWPDEGHVSHSCCRYATYEARRQVHRRNGSCELEEYLHIP
ncbi:hypothetical protein V496_10581 [Pseudogymnoascus sp. VKM F-4515 (FW-2607)]|nr:hypothetical protein V496_10581 [Pseudogymnoascus sp. VKM F-4515 (FW-2607)]